jgi:hypothetical protein
VEKQENGSFVPLADTINVPFPGLPIIQPALSPDGTRVAFMGAGNIYVESIKRNIISGQLYVIDLVEGELIEISKGKTYNNKGQWPTWVSDTSLLFSDQEDCTETGADEVQCDEDRTFSDLYQADLTDPGQPRITLAWGESDGTSGNWEACAFEDPWYMDGLVSFHGSSSADPLTNTCPFTTAVPVDKRGTGYGPQPGVLDLDNNAVHTFDLAGAGINACANFAGDDGLLICTEQDTIGSPYRECSIPGLSLGQCNANGGQIVLFNRLFGWHL